MRHFDQVAAAARGRLRRWQMILLGKKHFRAFDGKRRSNAA
jgi:hypothetical protein